MVMLVDDEQCLQTVEEPSRHNHKIQIAKIRGLGPWLSVNSVSVSVIYHSQEGDPTRKGDQQVIDLSMSLLVFVWLWPARIGHRWMSFFEFGVTIGQKQEETNIDYLSHHFELASPPVWVVYDKWWYRMFVY